MNTIWLDLLGAEVRYRGRDFKTRTIETGGQNADKLILIHGVGGHAEAYARNMQRLGKTHHAIAIDLLWHGLSAKPPFTPDMVPMYARQILDLLDDLGVEKAAIEGESLGGWVALWTALHHPDRVSKVILNTAAGIRWNRDKVKIDDSTGTNLLRERSLAAINDPNRETIKKRLEWLMASPDRVTEELIDLRTRSTRVPIPSIARKVFGERASAAPSRNVVEEDELAGLKVPASRCGRRKIPVPAPMWANVSRVHSGREPLLHHGRGALAAVGTTGRPRSSRVGLPSRAAHRSDRCGVNEPIAGRTHRWVAVLAAAAVLAAPAPQASAQVPAPLQEIRVGVAPSDQATALLYGDSAGLFRKAGLQITIEKMRSGAEIASGVVGGALDIGASQVVALIEGHARGVAFTMIAPTTYYSADKRDSGLIVPAASPMSCRAISPGRRSASCRCKTSSRSR